MATDAILNEKWPVYDNRKKREGADPLVFDCSQAWEINYLGRAIRKQRPELSADEIRAAIKACCKQIGTPYPKLLFLACVMARLA